MFWDQNGGRGCGGLNGTKQGCPSQASESAVGTIPSEAFTISGCSGCYCESNHDGCSLEAGGSTPEPSSITLFGSGVIGLVGILRRKLL